MPGLRRRTHLKPTFEREELLECKHVMTYLKPPFKREDLEECEHGISDVVKVKVPGIRPDPRHPYALWWDSWQLWVVKFVQGEASHKIFAPESTVAFLFGVDCHVIAPGHLATIHL
jgi:hypothetical protein